jgi:CRP/FNR family transcriptional regulator
MYACLHGRIRLVKYGQGSHVIVVCMADAGDIFAENVLFHYSHYPVTAIADMETTVLALQKTMMQQFLSRDRFREAFMSVVMSRMRDLTEKLVMVGGCDVEERFFRFIRSHYGMNDRISLELQKREVARYIDTTPETLSRLLNRLSSNGIVQWKKGELLVNWELWREKKA